MKKLIIKFFAFFKKEHLTKYIVEIAIFFVILGLFFYMAREDVISNVAGTVIGFLFSTMLIYILRILSTSFEDVLKVNKDTEGLLKLYKGEPSYRKKLELNGTSVEFAYADNLVDKGYTYEVVDNKDKMFELDDFVMNNYETLFSAHSGSVKFNGTTIRLDDMVQEGNKVTFYLSRSTVFNHLLTNRAIDFILFDNVTLRDVYEYGPKLNSYKNSKMSNHIGINALVFLSDGNILVPRRNRVSTISKNQITSSIAVKLDFPQGKDSISTEYLMEENIMDNLTSRVKIEPEDLHRENIDIRFLGLGQNIYEGGKPQLYYAVHLKDIDTQKYYELNHEADTVNKIDVDRCMYIADYSSYRFKKDYVTFDAIRKNGSRKKIKVKYEMSYLCNLWHYEECKG